MDIIDYTIFGISIVAFFSILYGRKRGVRLDSKPVTKREAIDLGLPSGLLWATCNVGASNPQDYGLYFAWGETTGYTAEQVTGGERAFDDATYQAGAAASISADLTLEQDAAHTYLGGNWRMPTEDEWQELIDNCNSTWTIDYNGTGVNGWTFTSKINGGSVFFPAAGYCYDSLVVNVGLYGRYWSATCYDKEYVSLFGFFPWNIDTNDSEPWLGFSVRAVCER